MSLKTFISFILLCSVFRLNAQEITRTIIHKTTEKVILDGILDDDCWQKAQVIGPFWQHFPVDSIHAVAPTEIFLSFDENFLYLGFRANSSGEEYIIPSLRRDFRAGGNDNVSFMLDTYNDGTNAFLFGTNPYGVQREALISNGGGTPNSFQTSWDQKWWLEVKREGSVWTGEMAIPFSSIRYTEENRVWRIGSYRFDTQTNEQSTLVRIPRNQSIFSLAFCQELEFAESLPKPGSNVVIIPYLSGGLTQDFDAGETSPATLSGIGGDVKVGIGPSLNLDLTVNPDFSQVEVDAQQTNLDRFELFFPERRQFFLENADLFGSFGTNRDRPFFSRRIGISQDTSTGQNIQNAIPFGARLTGKIDKDTRVGLLAMQAAPDGQNAQPGYLYTVAAVQRKIFSRSNIGFIAVNKQALTDSTGEWGYERSDYARVIGADLNLASANNVWSGKAYYHRSFSPNTSAQPFTTGGEARYNVREWRIEWAHRWVGSGYEAPVGFVPRTDYQLFQPEIRRFFYPKKGPVNQHGPGVSGSLIRNESYGKTDHSLSLFYNLVFLNNSRVQARVNQEYVYLFSSFDPSGSSGVELPEDSDYTFNLAELEFRSDRRKKLSYSAETTVGEYFNGNRYRLAASIAYRFQPFGIVSLNAQANQITLPQPYNSSLLWLVGPRLDLTFSRTVFLSAFVQYNSQLDNLNINARFQWRFKPVSDLFIVYTDNYLPGEFRVKNRALVMKVTYWLNV